MPLLLLGLVAGCGASPPAASELIEPGTRYLTEVSIDRAKAVLAQRSTEELVVTVWTAAGAKESAVSSGAPGSRPFIGWLQGYQTAAGLYTEPGAARVEVLTGDGKTVAGSVAQGAYLVAWPAPTPTDRFLIRILDGKGQELFRWAPPIGSPAA